MLPDTVMGGFHLVGPRVVGGGHQVNFHVIFLRDSFTVLCGECGYVGIARIRGFFARLSCAGTGGKAASSVHIVVVVSSGYRGQRYIC